MTPFRKVCAMRDAAMEDSSSAILSMLENAGGDGDFYLHLADFLRPFSDLFDINSNLAISRKNKRRTADSAILRPLAKKYLPFLSKTLKILPTALRKCPKEEEKRAAELLRAYRLVLDCLSCISPCLAGKPFSVQLQRCSLVCCLENWGNYSEAEAEGLAILESLVLKGRKKNVVRSGGILPDSTDKEFCDVEVAVLVIEVVLSLVRCAYKSKRKSDDLYRRILLMAEETRPWLRFLDSEAYNKYHLSLVNALFKCSLFLAGECMSFDPELVHNFCMEMSREWLVSSSKDQFARIARQISSSISALWDGRVTLMLEMLKCLLDSIPCKCKDSMVDYVNDILEFVHYVSESLLTASSSIQRDAYKLLCRKRSDLQEVSLSVACIFGFYAIGLSFRRVHSQCIEANSQSSNDETDYLQIFEDSLGILILNVYHSDKESSYDLAGCLRKFSSLRLQQKISGSCGCFHGDVSFFSFLDALAFLCDQLDGYVTFVWKDMMSEGKKGHLIGIDLILEAFHQFRALFLNKLNENSDKERLLESRLVLCHVVVASLKISFLASMDSQTIVASTKNVVACSWIKAQELKYLASSFYNIGASLYNVGQIEKASIVLQLCCTTSWTHIKLLGQLLEDDTVSVEGGDLSKSMIKDAAVDACSKSAVAFDVIHKCGNSNLQDLVVDCLLNWSLIEDLLELSTSPSVMVKQWVKIACREFKDLNTEDSIPSLSLLLQNHRTKLSKRVFGITLEQELLAYEESSRKYPKLFQRMQPKLLDVLLKEVYIGEENVLQRSKLIVKKGRALKTSGADGLKDSLECFSAAISSLEIACSDTSRGNSKLYYQLVLTYFLRAHFTQEANGEEEVILNDITSALSWWSRISEDIHFDFDYETTIQLFLRITDLLSLKGHLHFQLEMCKLIALLCRQNNIPLESCLDMLWNNRRLSHVCCSSPIDEIWAGNLSRDFSVSTNSIAFWMNCAKRSPSSLVGFLQAFSLSNSNLGLENSFLSQITFEEVKRTAYSLLSSASFNSDSASEAAYLLFDLSERLLHKGWMFEALLHAREALRLRKQILRRKFVPVGLMAGKIETIWSNEHLFTEAVGSIITEDTEHTFSVDSTITPWSALRCYLQSVFQVGIIYESTGNGAEAEILFRLGKTISLSLGFPFFGIIFSSHLGQVYRKKQLLDLMEKELNLARSILEKNRTKISCKRCKAVLESLICLLAGDLIRNKFENATGVKRIQSLSDALEHYKSAIDKLNHHEVDETAGLLNKDLTGKKSLDDNSHTNVGDQGKIRTKPKRSSRKKTSGIDSVLTQNLGSERNKKISAHKHTKCQNLTTIEGCKELSNWSSSASATEINLISDIILVKWEFLKGLLSLRLLSKIGKCMRINSENHEVHEIFWQSMSLLFDCRQIGVYDARFLGFVGMENSDDIFPVQRAILLYEMSLFCVKDCLSEGSRIKCCAFSKPEIPTILSWLFTAFVLAQDIPLLFQKICRSISAIISLSKSTGYYSLPFVLESLTEIHLAAFFHQASICSSFQHLYISNIKNSEVESKDLPNGGALAHVRRLERISDLEKFIIAFFNSLPSFTVVCISLLGGEYINIFGETLLLPSFYPAWMLLSRLNQSGPPTVMLLPVDFIHDETMDDSSGGQTASLNLEKDAKWECPWGNTLVDHVAPQYKAMLEENYLSLSQTGCNSFDTQKNRFMWWSERSRLNKQMDMFLRRLEDSWLGPWRCLLRADHTDFKCLDSVLAKLKRSLECKCKLDANISVLRIIMGGSQSVTDVEACIAQMILYKGCLGRGMCCGAESFRVFSSEVGETKTISDSIRSLILEAFNNTIQDAIEREPIVLVLDSDLQMLPWESLPTLRKDEVYRMPSMSSITLTLSKNSQLDESKTLGSFIPSIDPLDAYFLLNPSGDLSSTQMEFEEWFRLQNWMGTAGNVPATEELLDALQNHDLFLYFGHGSGAQYIPGNAIQKLKHCAATLLMGCSSGSLSLRGNYAPQGAPLSYLLAGSPAVIANLWEVSDKDIDRFGKSMLTSWLQELTADSGNAKDLGGARRTRKKALTKDPCEDVSRNRRIASFMSQARDACKLPHLIGAAPVCYGVPTLIKRRQKR